VLPVNLFPNNTTASSVPVSSSSQLPDTGQLSPYAQLISTLQQLQQSNPAQYQQVTQQIATNLQSASQNAQTAGNSTAATQLSQLASDFTSAATTGQLPNLQDLAKAIGGGHYGHSSGASGSSSASAASSTGASQALSQFLASLQFSGTSSNSLNAATIIQNTLTSAGIGTVGA
jgi:hypothetical protein